MRRTLTLIARAQQKCADQRKTYWAQQSAELVADYDAIFLGDWKPPGPKQQGEGRRERRQTFRETGEQRKRGQAAAERGRNRTDRDHGLGMFRQLMNERVVRCAGPKTFAVIQEAHTTRTCSNCGALTGPAEVEGLAIRRWTCSACAFEQDRDITSAINIARRGLEASAQDASGRPATDQKARIPKGKGNRTRPRTRPKVTGGAASAQAAKRTRRPLASTQVASSQRVGATESQYAVKRSTVQVPPLANAPVSLTPDTS
jgi:hypothetical protein